MGAAAGAVLVSSALEMMGLDGVEELTQTSLLVACSTLNGAPAPIFPVIFTLCLSCRAGMANPERRMLTREESVDRTIELCARVARGALWQIDIHGCGSGAGRCTYKDVVKKVKNVVR